MQLEGIPFSFSSEKMVGAYWYVKWQQALRELRQDAKSTIKGCDKKKDFPQIQKKLRKLAEAKNKQAKFLEEVLSSLSKFEKDAKEIPPIVLQNLYPNQNLLSYVDNIHRDWSWGEAENQESFDFVRSAIREVGALAVLGSGASRLAYDLHQKGQFDKTIAVDINPLLLIVAKRLMEGKNVKLYDFPIAPLSREEVCVLSKLQAPNKVRDGFEFLFSDATNLAFEDSTMDIALTPWLIDILPHDPLYLMKEINRILKPGGQWVLFGPLGFGYQNPEYHLSPEELKEVAVEAGFQFEKKSQKEMQYMNNPHSQHSRRENLFLFEFTKKDNFSLEIEKDEGELTWAKDTSKAIPLNEKVKLLKQSHQTYHMVLSEIDGVTPIKGLAQKLGPRWGLAPEEAEVSLKNFLTGLEIDN